MAKMTDDNDNTDNELEAGEQASHELAEHRLDVVDRLTGAATGDSVPTQLGTTKYVMAGFFAAGMAVTFIVSQTINGTWNKLANNVWLSQHAAFISRISEDDRPTYTMVVGALIGVVTTIYAYRRSDLRTWTNEVANELGKVTWPTKKEVTNSTMIVIVTSALATVFLALLDQFWGFVTNRVYGGY
jgi:preprotein translocase subunit SecE